jgi:hypothetical protein
MGECLEELRVLSEFIVEELLFGKLLGFESLEDVLS